MKKGVGNSVLRHPRTTYEPHHKFPIWPASSSTRQQFQIRSNSVPTLYRDSKTCPNNISLLHCCYSESQIQKGNFLPRLSAVEHNFYALAVLKLRTPKKHHFCPSNIANSFVGSLPCLASDHLAQSSPDSAGPPQCVGYPRCYIQARVTRQRPHSHLTSALTCSHPTQRSRQREVSFGNHLGLSALNMVCAKLGGRLHLLWTVEHAAICNQILLATPPPKQASLHAIGYARPPHAGSLL